MRIRVEIQWGDLTLESIEAAQQISRILGLAVVMELHGHDLTIWWSQDAAEMLREHEAMCQRMRAAGQ